MDRLWLDGFVHLNDARVAPPADILSAASEELNAHVVARRLATA
jgi:hypothetical protein